jgi:hypothetical protein
VFHRLMHWAGRGGGCEKPVTAPSHLDVDDNARIEAAGVHVRSNSFA